MALSKKVLKEFEQVISSQADIKVNDEQYDLLQKVFDAHNADIELVTERNELTEADSALNKYIGSAQRINKSDRSGKIIKVNPKVVSSIENFALEGSELSEWYHDMSFQIYSALGESDACLYLMLVASCSPQNQLTKNLIEASQIFVWFKTDLNNNQDNISSFVYEAPSNVQSIYELLRKKYRELTISKMIRGTETIPVIDAKLKNIVNTFRFYIDSNFSIDKDRTLKYITSMYNPDAKLATHIIGPNNPIRGLKVMNFALNLVDPDYSVSSKWYNVTIDTWMIRFFYPNITDKEASDIFKKPIKYMYLAKLVGDTATKLGISPTKLQASIWVAKLKSEGRNVDSFQKVLDNKIAEFKANNSQLENVEFTLKDVILHMSNTSYADRYQDVSTEEDDDVSPF